MNYEDATLVRTKNIIEEISSYLNLPNHITKLTKKYYIKTRSPQISQHVVLSALCMIRAINESMFPIPYLAVINAYSTTRRRVTSQNVTQLRLKLNWKLQTKKAEFFIPLIIQKLLKNQDVQDRIVARCIDFNYEVILENLSIKLVQTLKQSERKGIRPKNIAIVSIYLCDRVICKFIEKKQVLTQQIFSDTGFPGLTIRDILYRQGGVFTNKFDYLTQELQQLIDPKASTNLILKHLQEAN